MISNLRVGLQMLLGGVKQMRHLGALIHARLEWRLELARQSRNKQQSQLHNVQIEIKFL